jgi:ribosomal protein S18 acetylase RimI-like enzyme
MEVRRLTSKDAELAQTIISGFNPYQEEAAFPPVGQIQGFLSNETCYLVAAMDDDMVVGYPLAYRFPAFFEKGNTAYLYDIEVLPRHRQKGIGKKLISELLRYLKPDGVTEVWLGTAVDNLPAQKLFQVTGAKKEEEVFSEYFYYLD